MNDNLIQMYVTKTEEVQYSETVWSYRKNEWELDCKTNIRRKYEEVEWVSEIDNVGVDRDPKKWKKLKI